MKRSKKITALLAAAALLVTGACNNGGGRGNSGGDNNAEDTTTTTTTADSNAEFTTTAALGDYTYDAKNEAGVGKLYEKGKEAGTIKAMCYYDFAKTNPEMEIRQVFKERFNGEVEMLEITNSDNAYIEAVGKRLASADPPDVLRYEWPMLPGYAIKNQFLALDDWLDITSPVWTPMADVIERQAVGGKHYYFPQQMSPNYGVIYSTASIEAMGDTDLDPMDLYFKGEWTWEVFEKLMTDWAAQGTDKIGVARGESTPIHFAATAGIATIEINGTDVVNNLKSPQLRKTMDYLEKLFKEGYVYTDNNTWRSPDEGFADGKLLFYVMPIEWAFEVCQKKNFDKQLEGEIRAVPIPRCTDSDTYYLLGNSYGYLVPASAENKQGAAAWIAAGRIYSTDSDVVKKRRDKLLYNGPYYTAICTNAKKEMVYDETLGKEVKKTTWKCGHQFESEYGEEGEVCPECGQPRTPQFKTTYTEQQMQVMDDMVDPSKFTFLFDQHRGFGDNLLKLIKQTVDIPFGAVDAEGNRHTFTEMVESNYNAIETELNEYRKELQKT